MRLDTQKAKACREIGRFLACRTKNQFVAAEVNLAVLDAQLLRTAPFRAHQERLAIALRKKPTDTPHEYHLRAMRRMHGTALMIGARTVRE